jgi:hypothetical protein
LPLSFYRSKAFGEALHANPIYKGVPKVFFFHCCRGGYINTGVDNFKTNLTKEEEEDEIEHARQVEFNECRSKKVLG